MPDATITGGGSPFYIEIIVTNPIDTVKYKKYQVNQSRVLVINLQEEDRNSDYDFLESLIIEDTTNKYILSYHELNVGVFKAEKQSFWKWGIALGLGLIGFFVCTNQPESNHSGRRYQFRKRH